MVDAAGGNVVPDLMLDRLDHVPLLRPGLVGVMCPICLERITAYDGYSFGEFAADIEADCVAHIRKQHRLRYWLWRRTGARRFLGL